MTPLSSRLSPLRPPFGASFSLGAFVALSLMAPFGPSANAAVNRLSTSDVLRSALRSPLVERAQAGKAAVLDTTGNTPFISEVQIYGEIKPGQNDKKAGIKIYPRGWGETSYGRDLKDAVDRRAGLETDTIIGEELFLRYEALTLGAVALKKRNLVLEQMNTVESQAKAIKQRLRANQADPRVLLSIESDLQKARMDLDEAEADYAKWQSRTAVFPGVDKTAVESVFLQVPEPSELLSHLRTNVKTESTSVLAQAARAEEAELEHEMEKASNRRVIQSIDLSGAWDGQKSSAAVELTLTLPFISDQGVTRAQKLAGAIRESAKLDAVRRDHGLAIETLRNRLASQIKTYDTLSQSEELQTLTRLKDLLSRSGSHADVTTLLLAREKVAAQHLALISLLGQVYTTYLDYLNVSGIMTEFPYRNFLTARGEAL